MSKQYERVGTGYRVTPVPIYREKKSGAGALIFWIAVGIAVLMVVF